MENNNFNKLVQETQQARKENQQAHEETRLGIAKVGSWVVNAIDKLGQGFADVKLGIAKQTAWMFSHHDEEMAAIKDNGDKLSQLGTNLQNVGQKVDGVHRDVKVVDQKVDKISKKLNVRDMDGWDIFFGVASGLAFAALVAFLLRGLPESMAIIHDAYGQATGIDMERCRHIWIIIGLLGGFVGIFIGSCVAQWNCKRRG